MSNIFDILQDRYQTLVTRKEEGETTAEFLEDVRAFLADAQQAGASVADLNERSQLRAWMRFLACTLQAATGVYPDVTLQPLIRGQLIGPGPEPRAKAPTSPPLVWTLLGGAAAIIIAAGLVAIGWLSQPPRTTAETPTSTPLTFASHIAVGQALDSGGTLKGATDTFCQGTPQIVTGFTLEGIEPRTEWRWELKRNGVRVAGQPATPWGKETRDTTIRVLSGGPTGVEPGQYELMIYVGQQVVGSHAFQVLGTPPRAFDLRVSDVPDPGGEAPDEPRFEPGARVIYLRYQIEGLCPGLDVSHTLYHEGEPIQEHVERWSEEPLGQKRVSFQAPGNQPFPLGEYEVAVTVAGEEQGRVGFRIGEATTAAVEPALGDITVALGVQPDGTPILAPPDNRFDWNTKVVYAIFDYTGMADDLPWAAIWTRNGEEVARQEQLWDVEIGGTEGTRWVAYHDERGRTLPGGTYSVTLYIESIAQRTADFGILYYVPPQ